MRLGLALAAVLLAVAAPTARAAIHDDSGRYTAWASKLQMPIPDTHVHSDACPWTPEGGPCASENDVWIPQGTDRFEFAHELGHVFDAQVLDARARAWFTPRLGFPASTPWTSAAYDDTSPGYTEPAERFADAYAHCARRTPPSSIVGYGYLPNARTHQVVCNAIAVLGLVAAHQSTLP